MTPKDEKKGEQDRLRRLLGPTSQGARWIALAVAAAVIGLVVENLLSNTSVFRPAEPPPQPTAPVETPSAPEEPTSPSPSPTTEPSPTATPAPIVTPTLPPIETASDGSEMVLIKSGPFEMGAPDGPFNEKPVHTVFLDAFYLDKYEVANRQYAACVEAGVCTPPSGIASARRELYFGNEVFDDYPVIFVSWFQAKTYCSVWRGDDLPTEAQWEKAARWEPDTGITRRYPWGEDSPSVDLLNYHAEDVINDTTPVKAFAAGASPVGAQNMLGNVWEWVQDWYSDEYYNFSPDANPQGPPEEIRPGLRTVRGGSWAYDQIPRATDRQDAEHTLVENDIGFRCARNVE
jgi:formylglycine-generating enzyme required for sulfatase activity